MSRKIFEGAKRCLHDFLRQESAYRFKLQASSLSMASLTTRVHVSKIIENTSFEATNSINLEQSLAFYPSKHFPKRPATRSTVLCIAQPPPAHPLISRVHSPATFPHIISVS
jgi:hypothetical protein